MPEAILQDTMDTRDAEESSSSYRFYFTDDQGSLKVAQPDTQGETILAVPASSQKKVVHKMARGTLSNGVEVLALARHNGSIDVVKCSEGTKLISFRVDGMRQDIHRWVGLAVSSDCIYSCTSAGIVTQSKLEFSQDGQVTKADNHSESLAEPLQCCEFEPNINPKFLAIGGEYVHLSVFEIDRLFSTLESVEDDEENGPSGSSNMKKDEEEEVEVDTEIAEELSSAAKKRKRAAEKRSKAKELVKGEIWRAKNAPAKGLSIQPNSLIISIAFLQDNMVVVGTKMGTLKFFKVGSSTQRKPVQEMNLFHPKISPIKFLARSHNRGELIAADNVGRVYIVNWQNATVLYKYEVFAGAVVSLCPLPPAQGLNPCLITASAEKLLRLHSMPINTDHLTRTKENGKIQSVQFHPKGVRTLVWDGKVPQGPSSIIAGDLIEESDRLLPFTNDALDDVWGNMATVGDAEEEDEDHEDEHRNQRRRRPHQ